MWYVQSLVANSEEGYRVRRTLMCRIYPVCERQRNVRKQGACAAVKRSHPQAQSMYIPETTTLQVNILETAEKDQRRRSRRGKAG